MTGLAPNETVEKKNIENERPKKVRTQFSQCKKLKVYMNVIDAFCPLSVVLRLCGDVMNLSYVSINCPVFAAKAVLSLDPFNRICIHIISHHNTYNNGIYCRVSVLTAPHT